MKRTKMPDELKRFADPGDTQDEKPEGETADQDAGGTGHGDDSVSDADPVL